jgi:hypothetical protein
MKWIWAFVFSLVTQATLKLFSFNCESEDCSAIAALHSDLDNNKDGVVNELESADVGLFFMCLLTNFHESSFCILVFK